MDKLKIAKKLIKLREKAHISREKVAVDLHISYSAVSAYETGERIPRDELKKRIAEYFNVSVEELFYA